MKTLKIYVLFLVGLFTLNGYTQSPEDNRTKYNNYRANLKYFRAVGSYPKYSIIAERRNGSLLESGDAGVNQGWYIGVLATEYAVLIQEGNTNKAQETLNELFCALMAVERLDKVATSRFYDWNNNSLPPDYAALPDGVSVRTDLWNDVGGPNYGFYSDINELNSNDYPPPSYGNSWTDVSSLEKYFYTNDYGNGNNFHHTFYSQDQLYHMLMGLYLVYHYIPGGNYTVSCGGYNNQVYDFKGKAKEIALRFIDNVIDHGYNMTKPDGNDLGNEEGGMPEFFARPIIAIANKFGSNENYSSSYEAYWRNIIIDGTDVLHMVLVMAAISDENFSHTGTTASTIFNRSEPEGWESFYPLLHNNLHGGNSLSQQDYCDIEVVLNSAPITNPEFNASIANPFVPGTGGPLGWSSISKFLKTEYDQNYGGFSGKFSGVDYMLLYNLYRLRVSNTYVKVTGSLFGTHLCTNALLGGTANVIASGTVIAGNSISILNGFQVTAGNTFYAIIGDCGGNRGTQREDFEDENQEDETVQEKLTGTPFVNIYPNPNTGQFNVEVESNEGNLLIEVYDVMGKQVFAQSFTTTNQLIDISEQPRGIYLVKVTANNQVFTEKIIYQ